MRAQTVVVCGVPGVGKTTLIRSTVARLRDAEFCEAHELVLQAATTDSSGIYATSAAHRVARHYQLLNREFTARREQTRKRVMILECATVFETEAGWFEAPLHVLKSIGPHALVHVEDDCERLAHRRLRDRSTVRLTRSAIELARYQDRSLMVCEKQAERLGCSVHRVQAGAYDEFERVIQSM